MLARAVSSLTRPSSAVSFTLARASFHSSNTRHTNAFFVGAGREHQYLSAARVEVNKRPFEEGLLDKWGGAYPFFGAVAAIALTKEILLIDAELMLGGALLSVFTALYLAVGNRYKEEAMAGFNYFQDWFKDAHDVAITACELYKAEQAAKLGAGPVMQQYLEEYKAVMTAHAAAMALKPQHQAREKLLASLESIRVREQLAAAGQWRKFVLTYEGNVRQQLSDPPIRDALFSASIRSLNDDAAEEEVEDILEKVLVDAMEATDDAVIPENLDDLPIEETVD